MANIPEDLHYSKDHEWIRIAGDIGTVGITDHAQHSLGDVVFVELPRVGDRFEAHEAFGNVESVKAVSELYSPVAGEVVEVNETLQDDAEQVNKDPYGAAWMIKLRISDMGAVDKLMTAAEYEDYTKAETE
ncbi:MAG TPA: glycine cleavage system protein GcvH [Pyrinomonadaceae bacterium]|jgi:glycine cleavage system H protein|nr:glycine cleavage system protein GcvH [Pyrinomonadaceae bacterium]